MTASIKTLTAPCGMDCFNCQIQTENITEEMKLRMAQLLSRNPEEIPCAGCRPKQGKNMLMAKDCATWQCAEEHQVAFCHECPEFPCDKLAPCKDRADRLPHNMKVYNLCAMKQRGLEAWAEEASTVRQLYYEGQMVIGAGPSLDDM